MPLCPDLFDIFVTLPLQTFLTPYGPAFLVLLLQTHLLDNHPGRVCLRMHIKVNCPGTKFTFSPVPIIVYSPWARTQLSNVENNQRTSYAHLEFYYVEESG